MSVVTASRRSLVGGQGWTASRDELTTLFAFAGVVITAAVMLFEHVWND
jgi:heme exporter protein B